MHRSFIALDRISLSQGRKKWSGKTMVVRALLSTDNAKTWRDERVLVEDGISWDLGYPRTIQRAGGKCATVYYHHSPHYRGRILESMIWDL